MQWKGSGIWVLVLTLLLLFYGCTAKTLDDSTSSSSEASQPRELCTLLGCGEPSQAMLLFSFLIVLSGAVFVVYVVVAFNFHLIPESVAVVIYGILVGVALRFTKSAVSDRLAEFDPQYFFLYLLPAVIFETGFSMSKTAFFSNIKGILLLAIFGTFISFVVTGIGVWGVGQIGASFKLPLWDSMVLGSLLSATDPVATLAIFQALNVDQTLYMLVLGESILNDAMGIILYRSSTNYTGVGSMFFSVFTFFVVTIGSVLLGVGIALILSAILRNVNIGKFPALETIFMLMFSYMSYVLADALSLSPILAVFLCGIVFNHYGAYSLSPYTKLTSRQLFRTMAFICETCVFIYIGSSIANMKLDFDARLFIWTILFCLLGRALNVYPLMALLNKIRPKHKVSPQIKFVLWFAGLRGAVAFSLSLDVESQYKEKIRTVTLLIVHFTLFVFGCSTLPLLKFLKIRSAGGDKSLENITKMPQKSEASQSLRGLQPKKFINNLDERLFKKWFRRKIPPISRDAVEVFESLVSGSYEHEMRVSNVENSGHEENEHEHEQESNVNAGILATAKPDRKIKVQGEPIIGESPYLKDGSLLSQHEHD
eukprot:TRINITY_DN10298_c0_g1_i1.p1 TRINITY_DN10298_c0_g1~~TRINITY_DN10298_c0_g1_i1.p1  ORF type:complete len:625 (-),score=100.59 TRINITY_DN10298_c0_g1_i1:6-1793(-)